MILDLIIYTILVVLATGFITVGIYNVFVLPRVQRETEELVIKSLTDKLTRQYAEEWKAEFGEKITQAITDRLTKDLFSTN